jgi:chromosome segregation ATPase
MPDVDERLGRVEESLKTLSERIDERFAQVDQRFAQVDQRFEQVDQRFEQVDQRFGTLETEVQKLRVLAEANETQIKQIAEVQVHHGKQLQQLVDGLEPLKGLRDFVERIAHDHEHRITDLEKASHQSTPET